MRPSLPRLTEDGEIRCTEPHPDAPGRPCNGFVGEVLPGTVELSRSGEAAPGCTVLTCRRCGAKWRSCPVPEREVA